MNDQLGVYLKTNSNEYIGTCIKCGEAATLVPGVQFGNLCERCREIVRKELEKS